MGQIGHLKGNQINRFRVDAKICIFYKFPVDVVGPW